MLSNRLTRVLNANRSRRELIQHAFFDEVNSGTLDRSAVAVFIGQWWHPLHYFPTFLARSISVVPVLTMKTALSKILYQELGDGDPSRAHENIFIETMLAAGFTQSEIAGAAPLLATYELVRLYKSASADSLSALGSAYGTEVADLAMVSGIGHAVRRLTGIRDLPWVDIHVRQEPDHVCEVSEALGPEFSPDEEREILVHAERIWQAWIAFFGALQEHTSICERSVNSSV